jgi:hypothetical protein
MNRSYRQMKDVTNMVKIPSDESEEKTDTFGRGFKE